MYYVLTSIVENDAEDAILNGDSPYLKRIECSFRDGISLPYEDIITPIEFKISEFSLRGVLTDHLIINDIPGTVFSLDTKMMLEKIGLKNIQYFQLTLLDEFPDGPRDEDVKFSNNTQVMEYKDFFIANVVGLIDCVDHQKSNLEYFYPPEIKNKKQEPIDEVNNPFSGENLNYIDTVIKLVLDESKIDSSLKIFRLLDKPQLLVFHESIVDLIGKENLRGFIFVPIENYTDVIADEEEKEMTEKVEDSNARLKKPTTFSGSEQQPGEKKKSWFEF